MFHIHKTGKQKAYRHHMGSNKHEIGHRDQFVSKYIGKWYGKEGFKYGGYGEVATMGVQAVFFDKWDTWVKDPGFINFMLGLLATVP